MPKVVFWHVALGQEPAFRWTPEKLKKLGERLRPLFADACSTDSVQLDVNDIDWVPCAFPPGSLHSIGVGIEIETFGYPERIAKLTKERVLALKRDICEAAIELEPDSADQAKRSWRYILDEDLPLIWLKYLGPQGHHV